MSKDQENMAVQEWSTEQEWNTERARLEEVLIQAVKDVANHAGSAGFLLPVVEVEKLGEIYLVVGNLQTIQRLLSGQEGIDRAKG